VIIVVVDDNLVNVRLTEALVEQMDDCRAQCFTEPVAALAWCETNAFDLLIVDYMMPVLDGMIHICRRWQVSVGLALNSAWTMPEPALMRWISPGRMTPPPPVESLWAMAPSRM
jgi:CheY-like chemotaxis protein